MLLWSYGYFNREIFLLVDFSVVGYTLLGKTDSFETYSNWMDDSAFDKEAVEAAYGRQRKKTRLKQ